MKTITVNIQDALQFAPQGYEALKPEAIASLQKVNEGTGAGADFLGWVNLPSQDLSHNTAEIDRIQACAEALAAKVDYVVCIGIGGSYLGAKAVIEALSNPFAPYQPKGKFPKVLFAGQNIGEDYLADLTDFLKDKKFGIIVISKSGTTTEPAIAFRMLKAQLETQAGKAAAKDLIVAITDAKRGALRTLADQEGYQTFVIPDNVGGRFSVLTPVGLLPIAVAGHDIHSLLNGAAHMEDATRHASPDNAAQTYATMRNALYRAGKKIEILVNYTPALHYFGEWWKQLYGESEGKDGKGIFPAAVDLTTDLHSMGQWMQQGERTIFETVIEVEAPRHTLTIPTDPHNMDGLNYMAARRVDEVNKMAALGTKIAHTEGGVPVIKVSMPTLNEHSVGALIYFFEKACGISGYILGVNPFDQPGVEAYKSNMFALLGKPGYEEQTRAIRAKI